MIYIEKIDKKELSERDICTKYITPAIVRAGWNVYTQIREEVTFTKGRIIIKGSNISRGESKRADYILYYKLNIPIAVIEAKDNNHIIGDGMQQALVYAEMLDVPFVYSTNGDGFLEHDFSVTSGQVEKELGLDAFPSPEVLWKRYCAYKGIDETKQQIVTQNYYSDGSGKVPRYYQTIAINRTIEAIAKGQNRILLVMATGTGKTFTAFEIIWRLWKSRTKKRILYLADRNILIDQTKTNDFKPFGTAMTKIENRNVDTSFEIYLSLYQAVTGSEEWRNIYKQFSRDFFDLVVVDECHRGSAAEDSAWREILEYFSSATQIGMTATPKETKDISNIHYFGEPIYTYSLKQGIEDGFLAPYKVIRIDLDKDLTGWRPEKGKQDKYGQDIEDRIYNQKDFDKALTNENADLVAQNRKYVMRITGDNAEGKAELDNFILPESRYPVIATTSKLMNTGVDAQTCKLIVLDQRIQSMTVFKQIIGRGTRINEDFNKFFFTIMDFKKATELFADPKFDGEPVVIYQPKPGGSPIPPDEGGDDGSKRIKYVVNDVPVKVVAERVQYYDQQGKLITESLKDYTRNTVLKEFASLDSFLARWSKAEKKDLIIQELEGQGLLLHALEEEVGKDFDPFDLICHVVYDKPPLSRKERAAAVRKKNYFSEYGEKARAVLNALLDKYADEGIGNIENLEVLKVQPINQMGTPFEIISIFGGKDKYLAALRGLETQIYMAEA